MFTYLISETSSETIPGGIGRFQLRLLLTIMLLCGLDVHGDLDHDDIGCFINFAQRTLHLG